MADLIDRAALLADIDEAIVYSGRIGTNAEMRGANKIVDRIKEATAVDAVEVDALKAWLYEIALNNTSNYLGDACEEIISRLDGLRVFARERRTDATD